MTFDPDTGLPHCEPCCAHWWRDRPRVGNWTAYIHRYHLMGHHA